MKIEQLTLQNEDACEEFLLNQPAGLIYYSRRFRSFLRELLACEEKTLLVFEGGRITGMLPLMSLIGPLGEVINSLPFYGSLGGVLSSTERASAALLDAYNELMQNTHVASSTLISNPLAPADYSNLEHNLVDKRIGQFTYLMHAEDNPERLMDGFESSTRRNIRKALNSGITITTEGSLEFLERVHRDNMAHISGKAKPASFFSLIERHFKESEDYQLYTATKDGAAIAALLVFYYNKVVEYYIPVIIDDFRTYQPLALIIYQAMKDAARKGFTIWNWGGTWLTQEGVYQFKKKWGTVEKYYTYFVNIKSESVRNQNTDYLTNEYPFFYTIPFGELSR